MIVAVSITLKVTLFVGHESKVSYETTLHYSALETPEEERIAIKESRKRIIACLFLDQNFQG